MRTNSGITVLIATLLLWGCAVVPAPPESSQIPPPPPPGEQSTSLPSDAAIEVNATIAPNYVATREVVWANQELKDLVQMPAPKAFVLLDSKDNGRNKRICEAFVKVPSKTTADLNPDTVKVPTFWMIKDSKPADASIDKLSCDALLAKFDFIRAAQLGNAFQIPNQEHPYLLALDANGKGFYIDIDKASKAQIQQVMVQWFSVAAKAPNNSAGTTYKVWWLAMAEGLCKKSWVQSTIAKVLPGFAGPVLGLAFDEAGCKAVSGKAILA